MTTMTATMAGTSRREILALQAVIGLFVLLRLYMHLAGAPLGDETYYWYWGQNLDFSYYDHPPLHAWLLGLVSLLGWSTFSTRALTWLTLGGTLWIFWLWSRRLAPDDPQLHFWRTAAIYLASPLFFAMTLVSYHDHLLIFLCLLSAHCFLAFAERWEPGGNGFRWLYAGAVALGLAVLTKYNAVFFGLGFGLFVLLRPQLRPLLKSPHLWLAAALAIAMQAPVFYWNIAQGFASYEFHFSTRWGGEHAANIVAPLTFLFVTALSLSPFLIWPLIRLLTTKAVNIDEARRKGLALSILSVSTLSLMAISIFLGAFFYWNIVAYVAAMPLLVRHVRSQLLLWAHLVFGLLVAAALVFNFSVAPISPLFGGRDGGSAVNFGWDIVPTQVQSALDAHPGALLAGTRYSNATQVGFALQRPDVTALSFERDQFDYWFNPVANIGRDFIILGDDNDGAPEAAYLREHFAAVAPLDTIPVTRFGVTVFNFQLYLAQGYRP